MKTILTKHPWRFSLMAFAVFCIGLLAMMKFTARAQNAADLPVWLDTGINAAGSFQMNQSGVFTVADTGNDLWGTNDAFHFVYQPLDGNGQITARILGANTTNEWAKAGVMLRETLDGGARNVMNLMAVDHGVGFEWRPFTSGHTILGLNNTITNAPVPYWVRLVRNGDWVGGYTSSDGVNWTLTDWENIDGLAPTVYVGVAWCNHDPHGASGTAWFDQVSIAPADLTQAVNPAEAGGDGLLAEYFDNRHLWGPAVDGWVDSEIDFGGSALFQMGSQRTNEFGIRWSGELVPQFSEPYTISVLSDDGVRVWLNEQLIIDDWKSQRSRETVSAPVNLVAGQHYLLRVEYFQNHGWAQISLRWSSPSTPEQVIPQSQLYSQPTLDPDGSGLPVIWEQVYFGQTGVDANADPDGDGLSNLQEYWRHTNPTNALNWGVPNEWTQGSIEDWDSSEGAASYNNGVFSLINSCTNTMQPHLYYLYQPIGTNGQMTARILGMNGNNIATAGIMLRETLDGQARNVTLQMTPSNGMAFPLRDMIGGKTLQNQQGGAQQAPYWLKVVRSGDWLGGYVSPDGVSWTLLDWEFIQGLAPQAFIGLAVTCQGTLASSNALTTAQFDQVNLGPANPADILNPVEGTGDGVLASYRNDSLLYLPGLTNRVEPTANYYFVHGPPFPFLNPDGYGVCMSGEIQAQFTEAYQFSIQSRREDWVRVWLNDQLIIDGWRKWHPDYKTYSAPVNLVAGQHYLIRVEMYDNLGQGVSILRWKSPSTPEHLVTQSQLYSQPTLDSDGSGLPVIWEQIYFGQTGVDPNADPDGDGLSNLQEYKYHTNPTKADTDGDGMPDAWEIAHGLDPQFNDAALSYNNSDYDNLQDYLYGLDPLNPDSNQDGLPDSFEEQYLGTGTSLICTNPVTAAAVVYGAQATNYLGDWQVDGNDIYCLDRRGGLDFNFSLNNADKCVLNLIGTQNQFNPFAMKFKLLLAIDRQTLGHHTLTAGYGTNGTAELVLPYLQAGSHTLHVFWDGAASHNSLRIRQLKLLSVGGTTNATGMKNWAMQMIRDESGLDLTTNLISSYTSPVCLEGNDPYPSFMQVTNNLTNSLTPVATSDGRWYLNVPLRAGTQTVFQASYQNHSLNQTRNLRWQQVNLLNTSSLVIRVGDTLLFNAVPTNGASGTTRITVGGNTYTNSTSQPVAYRFVSNGLYTVSGNYRAGNVNLSGSISVDVVRQNLPNLQPDAWTGMQRPLLLSSLAPEATLQADSRLSCTVANVNSNGAVQLTLATANNDPLTMIARIGTNGPVLDSATVSGFDEWSGNQTYSQVIQVYPDGSQLVEMLMISSPVEPDVSFVLEPIVSGVIFDDGTTVKTLTAADFDSLGQCRVRFIRPASVHTSVCHMILGYQGNYLIGYRH